MSNEKSHDLSTAIAVIGVGCRFPKADDAESYWANIVASRACFSDIPRDRWDHRAFFHSSQREVDKTWTHKGGFIEEIKTFPALHFGIAPRRLEVMDPQQRLLIEATRVALQDAGYERRDFDRRRTGVFMGVSVSEFKNLSLARISAMQIASGEFGPPAGDQALRNAILEMTENLVPTRAFSLSGALTALAAAAVSQVFDFGGPSYTIDAACASASVAIHDAVSQLRAGMIDSAVAGGAYLNLTPDNLICFTRIGAISPSGVCRPFEARADGFLQSDGVGVVFLKRYADAVRDGDRILALIRGTGCNNDGRGEGPMTPRVEGQRAALEACYRDAGFSPATVSYFEAHGTATSVGDPVEIEALGRLLSAAGLSASTPAVIGSVKAVIGHAMSAAGIAGFIKALKVIEHQTAPGQPDFVRPNAALGLERFPLAVPSASAPLAARPGAPLRVAVSSFGFGGTNSHMVLEAPPERRGRSRAVPVPSPGPDAASVEAPTSRPEAVLVTAPTSRPEAVLVTAPTLALLEGHLDELHRALGPGGQAEDARLADVAYTLNARRRHERFRAVLSARTRAELMDALLAAREGLARARAEAPATSEVALPLNAGPLAAIYDSGAPDAPARKVAFMFPGQGAQRLDLFAAVRDRAPAFRSALERLEASVGDLLPRSLSSYVYPGVGEAGREAAEAELTRTEVCQPAMAALTLAAAEVLREVGVVADLSLGHSLGEFTALANAGVIEAGAAVRVVALRGRAMRDLGLEDPGAMAAVLSDAETVRRALGDASGVFVANVNHPRQVSISGATPAVGAAVERLRAAGLDVRPLPVSHAFHTPLLAGIRPAMEGALDALTFAPAVHPVVSCVSAEAYDDRPDATRETLLLHATEPVDFVRALRRGREAGASVFVNLGAGGTLSSFARATLPSSEVVTVNVAAQDDDGGFELARGLATLAALGVPVDFEAFDRDVDRAVTSLPETPLAREVYWILKDHKQPHPRLDHPLPTTGKVVHVESPPSASPASVREDRALPRQDVEIAMTRSPEKPEASSELVKLFREQAEILRRHAEILAEQNRLLAGGGAVERSASAVLNAAPVEPRSASVVLPSAPVEARGTSTTVVERVAQLVHEPSPGPASPRVGAVNGQAEVKGAGEGVARAETKGAGGLGVSDVPVALTASATPVAPTSPGASPVETSDRVFDIVARISAFPRESLRRDQRLVDELGFDSLMVADLGGAIQTAFPDLGALPQGLFGLSTTVGDVADHIARASQRRSAQVASAPRVEAPISRYRVVAKATPRRTLSLHDPAEESWLVTDDGSALPQAIAEALACRGARVLRVQLTDTPMSLPDRVAPSGVSVWPAAFVDGLPAALARAGVKLSGVIFASALSAGGEANPVLQLHPLVAELDVPRLTVLTGLGGKLGLEPSPELTRHLGQAGLLGYTKSLARERPHARVRAIDVERGAPAESLAEAIVLEILGADQAPEVGLTATERFVAELVPVAARAASREINRDDVVLITGGLGQIGGRLAEEAARRRARGVILVGRRPEDEAVKARLAQLIGLGTKAAYVSADVTDAAALEAALKPAVARVGVPTVAFHGAGLIADAPAARKTVEDIARVMAPKVAGARALLTALPSLRELVFLSSWAGRFGNAGQVDYAAANEVLDRLAVAGELGGQVRVLALDLPPWANTRMVQSIPAAIREAMKSQGVTFLEDEEGVAAVFGAWGSGVSGIEVVGRALSLRELKVCVVEDFSDERHPYLTDHRLQGRPVVPLASATDLVAHAIGAPAPGKALVVEDLELVRGLMGGERAVTRVLGRVEAGGVERSSVSIAVEKEGQGEVATAYRATASLVPGPATIERLELTGEPRDLPFTLDQFYAEHTFHGPMLRGVVSIERMTTLGIRGVVRCASPAAWFPGSAARGLAVDPLVIDGSFQLAAYWATVFIGRAGYPTGFDRLVLQRPFGAGPITCTLALRGVGEGTFEGSIFYEDASGPIARLENVRGRLADVVKPAPAKVTNGTHAPTNGHVEPPARAAAETIDVPRENWDIALFPEVESLEQRFQMAELMGLGNPYFHVHAGTARNRSVVDGVEMVNFSSYNYLGFSGHPEVVAAAKEAIERYGTSVSASRVASGERPLHQDLEHAIAEHIGVEDSIVYVSGHATNVTTIGHMLDREDLILHDSLIHDSILQGIYLSGATRRPFPHNDLDALEKLLAQVRKSYRRVLITVEGIYSMDGDTCDLPRLIELKKRYRALLLVDEAHSIGVLGPAGRGIAHHFPGVDPKDVDLWMGTLSKSFASCGGYIAGSRALVKYLKYTAPGFVYSAGITPPNAAAALKSLELMQRDPGVVEKLRHNSKLFLELARQRGIDTGHAIGAAVVPAIIGNSLDCIRLSEALAKRRINVQPIVYPAVEDNASRLRFFLSSTHTEEELRHTVDVLVEELERIRRESSTSLSL